MASDVTIQWYYKILKEQEEKRGESFDRVEFYKEYFKNLSPAGFKITTKDNTVIITID